MTDERIDWLEWAPEAFARARNEQRLLLVAVMAPWCHQSSLMDRQTFTHPDVIQRIADHYAPVRIDRDQRPDVDRRLQEAAQVLRVGGGWPLLAIFTPAGEMAFAATWLPPHDDHLRNRRGLTGLLDELHTAWTDTPEKVEEMGAQLVLLLEKMHAPVHTEGSAGEPLASLAIQSLVRQADHDGGGIRSDAAKFPHPTIWELTTLWSSLPASEEEDLRPAARQLTTTTLEAMALGGLHDQLDDGFHRYTVGPDWSVPEFEKLTAGNAALLRSWVLAWRAFGDPAYADIARGIVRWLLETVLSSDGGFYQGVHADADGDDDATGRAYTWTLREIEEALDDDDECDAFTAFFGVQKRGDMPAPRQRENVLRVSQSVEEVAQELAITPDQAESRIQSAADKLLTRRRQRSLPPIDRRRFVSVNAETAAALLIFARFLPDEPLAEAARAQALRTLDTLLTRAHQAGLGFMHRVPEADEDRHDADAPNEAAELRRRTDVRFLADQATAGTAMFEAWEATGESRWLEAARDAVAYSNHFLWDRDGGYLDVLPPAIRGNEEDWPTLTQIRRRPVNDDPQASGNGLMVRLLTRLHLATNEDTYKERARATVEALSGLAQRQGFLAASFAVGVMEFDDPPTLVLIAGSIDDDATRALWTAARRTAPMNAVVAILDADQDAALADTHGLEPVDGLPAACIVAQGRSRPPITSPDDFDVSLFE